MLEWVCWLIYILCYRLRTKKLSEQRKVNRETFEKKKIISEMFQKIFNSGSHLSLSIVLSTGSFLFHSHVETRKQQREQKRAKINNKIKDLYGPIVGNRILHRSAIRALENHYQKPLIEVITDVCKRKDSEELENWRCFYIKMLAPLGRVQTRFYSSCL